MLPRVTFIAALAFLGLFLVCVLLSVLSLNTMTEPQTATLSGIATKERIARRSGVNLYIIYYFDNPSQVMTRRTWLTGLPCFARSELKRIGENARNISVSYHVLTDDTYYFGTRPVTAFGLRRGTLPVKNAWYWVSVTAHVTGRHFFMGFLFASMLAAIAAWGFSENTPVKTSPRIVLFVVNFVLFWLVFIYCYA